MPNNLATIKEIKQKLEGLLKNYASLQKKSLAQEQQIKKLEVEQKEFTGSIDNLQHQNFLLKSALQDLKPAEKKQFDQKIGDYIKSIDKAIALLSE